MKTYYEILGVSENADASTIKKAYRGLAKKYHPDIYKGEDRETKFQEITKAYEVLGDEDKRAAYDRQGHSGYEQRSAYGGNQSYGQDPFSGFDFGNFDSGSFGNFSSSGNTNFGNFKMNITSEMPWWKKLLFALAIVLFVIVMIIGWIAFTIFNTIMLVLKQIFK